MTWRKIRRLAIASCAALLQVYPAGADELGCPGAPIVVVTKAADADAAAICAPALWAYAFLARCGMVQERELVLEIVDRVTHPIGIPVIALFDASLWRI